MTEREGDWLKTSVGGASADRITLRGRDLAADIMGKLSFSQVAFLLAAGREPSPQETKLFDAVLASLADHGLTPTALAARFTYTGAPESMQGAIAAGLLGTGSVFLGPVEDTATFLAGILTGVEDQNDDAALRAAAADAVGTTLQTGGRVPGLGHPIHSGGDPRTARLYEIARETELLGPHMRLLVHVGSAFEEIAGKALPINGAGVAGAALADLGFPPGLTRGFALLARTAGLIGHLSEEAADPIGMRLWKEIHGRANEPG